MASIGIDLGTSNCCVAVWTERGSEILQNEEGDRTIPAYVSFTDHGHLVGKRAMLRSLVDPKNTVFDVMQLVGRKHRDVVSLLQDLPYEVVQVRHRLKINVMRKKERCSFFPEAILAMIICELKRTAESHLQKNVIGAVIGIPGCFNLLQKKSIEVAATVAGLNVCRLVTSTLLASVTYGVRNHLLHAKGKIVVVDIGAGSVTASVVSLQEGMFLLMSIVGSCNLGGDSFTTSLVIHSVQQLNHLNPTISSSTKLMAVLRSECRKTKHSLSTCQSAYVSLESLKAGCNLVIARNTFESLTEHLLQSVVHVVSKALDCAGASKYSIHDIVLVGGSTRIPKVQEALRSFFHGKELNKSVNPDESVAYGAAIQAAILAEDKSVVLENVVLVEKLPYALGIEVDGALVPLVPANRTVPSVNTVECERDGRAQLSPINIKVYEGENPDVNANVLVGNLTVLDSNAKRLSITLNVNSSQEVEMEVSDLEQGTVLLKNSPIHECHSQEEQEYMRFRHLQLQKEEQDLRETSEARNDLEAALIAQREEIECGTLKCGQEMTAVILSECRMLSELLESAVPLSGGELRCKKLQLQHIREIAILKISESPTVTTSKVRTA